MGLRYQYLNFIEKAMILCTDPAKPAMVELGNQDIRENAKLLLLYKALGIKRPKTGKEFYSRRGFKHQSIDLNGKNGSLKHDLSKGFDEEVLKKLGTFDVLTNSGTSEHVKGQYGCFKNCHSLIKKDGIMVHIVPRIGSWKNHGLHYYDFEFFVEMAELNDYAIVMGETFGVEGKTELVAICLQKKQENEFMGEESFTENLKPLLHDK